MPVAKDTYPDHLAEDESTHYLVSESHYKLKEYKSRLARSFSFTPLFID